MDITIDRASSYGVRRIRDRHLLANGEEVRRHQTAGRSLVVREKTAKKNGTASGHLSKKPVTHLRQDSLEKIRGVVGCHGLENAAGIGRILVDEILEHTETEGPEHLGERLGSGFDVHGLKKVGCFRLFENLQSVGGIGSFLRFHGGRQCREIGGTLEQGRHPEILFAQTGGILD